MARLPNLLIAGVTKAGTTSLFSYLVQHADVCGSSVKETEYFSPLLYPDGALAPLADYARYFRGCGDARYVMEATPNYWYGGARLLDAVEETLSKPRYIVSLRDPVDRFWSELTYMQSKTLLPADLPAAAYLERCVELRAAGSEFTAEHRYFRTLSTGMYVEHLPALLDRLDDRARVVFFEDLVNDAAGVVAEIFAWLLLDPVDFATFDFAVENSTQSVRSAPVQQLAHRVARLTDGATRRMPVLKQRLVDAYGRVNKTAARTELLDEPTRDALRALYAPYNRELRDLLLAAGYTRFPEWLARA